MAIQEEELAPNEDFLDDVTSDMRLNRFDRSNKKKKKKIQAPVEEFNILNQLNFFTQEIESARKEEKSRN